MSTEVDVSTKTVSLDEALAALLTDSQAVVVFSKDDCVQCGATYRKLGKKNLDFLVVNVAQDPLAYDHVVKLGFSQVPVVQTSTRRWSGYRPGDIDALAALLTV